jgi:hypothetical protein
MIVTWFPNGSGVSGTIVELSFRYFNVHSFWKELSTSSSAYWNFSVINQYYQISFYSNGNILYVYCFIHSLLYVATGHLKCDSMIKKVNFLFYWPHVLVATILDGETLDSFLADRQNVWWQIPKALCFKIELFYHLLYSMTPFHFYLRVSELLSYWLQTFTALTEMLTSTILELLRTLHILEQSLD